MSRTSPKYCVSAGFHPLRRLASAFLVTGLLAACALPLAGQSAGGGKAYVIPITGEINDILSRSVERRLAEAQARGARTIIFELNTPGGMVTSALDICRQIKNLPPDVRSVAWVHHEAFSAGAMIAVACQKIIMSPASSIGDCAPIMVSSTGGLEELPATERAKAESPVLQEFRDSASRNGYDPLLCRAMVSVGEEVWWLENSGTGERQFVNADKKAKLIDDVPAEKREWRTVEKVTDGARKRELTLDQPIDRKDALLTLSQTEAFAFGLASGIAGTLEEVTSQLEITAAPVVAEISGWEHFSLWLNSPLIRGILLAIAIIGGYVEFHTPGVIVPGITAAVALAIFIAAPYAAGLADIWTIVLLIAGLVLLAIELFVIPGFGFVGLLGVVLVLISLLGTFVPREPGAPPFSFPSHPVTWDALKRGVLVMAGSIGVATIGIAFLMRYLPHLPITRRLVLATPSGEELTLPDPNLNTALVGDIGVVVGDLRPGGKARFGHRLVDVQSQGDYVEAGARVQVIERQGMTVLVRPLRDEA